MTAKKLIVFLLLNALWLLLLVACGHVAGHWLALALGFRALENDCFPCHKLIFLCLGFWKFFFSRVLG